MANRIPAMGNLAWRKDKAKQMIAYYEKRINSLKNIDADWARNEAKILQGEINSYYLDFPELTRGVLANKANKI